MTIDDTPENIIKPPEWLDENYLSGPLREGLEAPQLEIVSSLIKPATAMGDNYVSQMFRATLLIKKTPDDEPQRLSIVIKTLPKKGKATDMLSEWSIFKKEATMLTEILPKINKTLMDSYAGMEPLSAKCIWFGDDPEEVIILQDLKELGFGNADRHSGLPLNLVNIALENMGKFHAASYALIEKEPERVEAFRENVWCEKYQCKMPGFFQRTIQNIINEVVTWENTPKDYIPRLQDVKDTLLQHMFEAATVRDDVINVMQHGDCWTNNFMFRWDSEKVTGFKFVDFQMCNINSAAMDLIYFIFTSPKTEFKTEKIDEMIATYYESFMQTVNDLGVVLKHEFTVEQLKKEFLRRLHFGLVAMLFVFPITVLEPKKAPDINDFMEESKNMGYLYQSKAFKEGLLKVIPYFIENGVL